jgi:hypothetical protein
MKFRAGKKKKLEMFGVMTNDIGLYHTKYDVLVAYSLLYKGYRVFHRGKPFEAWH